MTNFFDDRGRDQVIYNWLKRYKPAYAHSYVDLVAKKEFATEINELILFAFEAGVAFGRITKRETITK
jgi:hypothetical protein